MGVIFPNETPEYRSARAALLQREVALRREMEAVAAQLRKLPPDGDVHLTRVVLRIATTRRGTSATHRPLA